MFGFLSTPFSSTWITTNTLRFRHQLCFGRSKRENSHKKRFLAVASSKNGQPSNGEGLTQRDAKQKALQGVLQQIEKTYGRGSIMRLGEMESMKVETTPSGSVTLDAALGGGYPRGRLVEIFGPESSGKTTLALHAIAEVQKAGGVAAFGMRFF